MGKDYKDRYGIPGKSVTSLLRRYYRYLSDSEWDKADDFLKWCSENGWQKGLRLSEPTRQIYADARKNEKNWLVRSARDVRQAAETQLSAVMNTEPGGKRTGIRISALHRKSRSRSFRQKDHKCSGTNIRIW